MLYAFSYTVPSGLAVKTFVVAGSGELPASGDPHDLIRRGETSPDAIRDKVRFVLGVMESRLRELGADWPDVTTTDVYTVHDIYPLLPHEILPRLGAAKRHGITWHYTRPPIVSIEYEMDLRGCRREIVIS